jgi:hypothetical protein
MALSCKVQCMNNCYIGGNRVWPVAGCGQWPLHASKDHVCASEDHVQPLHGREGYIQSLKSLKLLLRFSV